MVAFDRHHSSPHGQVHIDVNLGRDRQFAELGRMPHHSLHGMDLERQLMARPPMEVANMHLQAGHASFNLSFAHHRPHHQVSHHPAHLVAAFHGGNLHHGQFQGHFAVNFNAGHHNNHSHHAPHHPAHLSADFHGGHLQPGHHNGQFSAHLNTGHHHGGGFNLRVKGHIRL